MRSVPISRLLHIPYSIGPSTYEIQLPPEIRVLPGATWNINYVAYLDIMRHPMFQSASVNVRVHSCTSILSLRIERRNIKM